MQKSEMAVLLSLLSAADGRHVNQIAIETWHEVAGHLDFDDARAAVIEHVGTEDRHMTLAQLIAGAIAVAERSAPRLAIGESTPDLMFEQWCRENGTTAEEYRRHVAAFDEDWVRAVHRRDSERRAATAPLFDNRRPADWARTQAPRTHDRDDRPSSSKKGDLEQ